MQIIASYPTKAEATQVEHDLQVYWNLPTDRSKHGSAKLTEEQVREIKTLLAQKISGAEIARRYGVGRPCISRIKNGWSWTHK